MYKSLNLILGIMSQRSRPLRRHRRSPQSCQARTRQLSLVPSQRPRPLCDLYISDIKFSLFPSSPPTCDTPLLFDDMRDTRTVTQVMFIDSRLKNYEQFVSSCNENTFAIVYSSTSNRDEILSLLNRKFKSIERLSLAFSNPQHERGPMFLNQQPLFIATSASEILNENGSFLVDDFINYGIYANGKLVESCSKNYLINLSDMQLIE